MNKQHTDMDTDQPVLCSKGLPACWLLYFGDQFFRVRHADRLVVVATGEASDYPEWPEGLDPDEPYLVCSCGEFVEIPAGCRVVVL